MRTESTARERTVVITGASAGVGRAIARRFARRGDRIALVARGEDGLEAAAADVRALGGTALIQPADVSDASRLEDVADEVERRLGPIDVWVNNAMVTVMSPISQMRPEEYERVTAVTYLGTVYGTLAALRRMRPRDRGSIVQVGSVLAYRGIPLQSAYCGAKHAIQGFCDSLWSELEHDDSHVHMTMVHLPGMNTPQFTWARSRLPREPQPMPPIYQPEVAADAVVWAAEHDRRAITVGGRAAAIVWGNKLAPRLGDWFLSRFGYDGQQTDVPARADRPDNLYEPMDEHGDWGVHGPFDSRARAHSTQLELNKRLPVLACSLAGIALGALVVRSISGH